MVAELGRRWVVISAVTFLSTVTIRTALLSCLLQLGLVDPVGRGGVVQSWLTATRNLLIYLAVDPGVLIAVSALAVLVGTVAMVVNTSSVWLSRITWRAASLSLALPLAAAFNGFDPPWVTWCGFAVICMLLHGCTAVWVKQRPAMATAQAMSWTPPGTRDAHRHDLVAPVTFPSLARP